MTSLGSLFSYRYVKNSMIDVLFAETKRSALFCYGSGKMWLTSISLFCIIWYKDILRIQSGVVMIFSGHTLVMPVVTPLCYRLSIIHLVEDSLMMSYTSLLFMFEIFTSLYNYYMWISSSFCRSSSISFKYEAMLILFFPLSFLYQECTPFGGEGQIKCGISHHLWSLSVNMFVNPCISRVRISYSSTLHCCEDDSLILPADVCWLWEYICYISRGVMMSYDVARMWLWYKSNDHTGSCDDREKYSYGASSRLNMAVITL